VHAFLPGPSEAWAYVAALALTAAITGTTGKHRLVVGGSLGIGALIGGALLVANASLRLPDPSALGVGCRDPLVEVADRIVLSTASGDVDGTSLGRVEAQRYPGTGIDIHYATYRGDGNVQQPRGAFGAPMALERAALGEDERLTADDLGIDMIPGIGASARHCQLVIDGPSAVQGFPVLRWLVGEDERTPAPGAGLEAWRGTLDYWIEPATPVQGTTAAAVVVLAAVSVDGQPPDWPIRGLHATLRAAVVGGGL
jgi:hypothetical protein